MAKVILDAAYGGQNPGGAYGNRLEKNDNLRLAKAVGKILEENGIEVAYTREADEYLSIPDRIKKANEEDGDLYVSFLRMRGTGLNPRPCVGFFISESNRITSDISTKISENLKKVGYLNYGTELYQNAIIKQLSMPALFIRVGFIDDEYNNEVFDKNFQEIANSIASGIIENLEKENAIPTFASIKCENCNNKTIINSSMKVELDQKNQPRYSIEVGVYKNYNSAMQEQFKLLQLQYLAEIVPKGEYYSVQIGYYQKLDEAVSLEQNLKILGYSTMIITIF